MNKKRGNMSGEIIQILVVVTLLAIATYDTLKRKNN
jgi:hypothetical protein